MVYTIWYIRCERCYVFIPSMVCRGVFVCVCENVFISGARNVSRKKLFGILLLSSALVPLHLAIFRHHCSEFRMVLFWSCPITVMKSPHLMLIVCEIFHVQ